MRIKVQTILDLVPVLGGFQTEVEVPSGASVREAVEVLVRLRGEELEKKLIDPASGQPYRHFRWVLNGRDLAPYQGLDTTLKEGDTLLIIPPASGG
ncbi:MAG: MoaD/ThiS family protein [Clostridia bacterium]|jgi:molybdopterin converting factor small subunit|nr:MoaD/ThiS family protein [Clostridia bacterium]MDH7573106.1 MoaD/ThiS family protein [Clostridia bacterium]